MIIALIKNSFSKMDWPDRLQAAIATGLQVAIFVLTINLLFQGLWLSAFAGTVVFVLTFIPPLLERQFSVYLPVEFSLITTAFLFGSFVLGEVRDFYERYWWWDLMLHSTSSLTIGLAGFLMIYVFYMTNRVNIQPIYLAIITLSLTVTTGTLWEIFEFSMDWFFGLNMQKSGLVDTMTDLIVDAAGGLLAAILGYFYVKNGDSLVVDRLIKHFFDKNPDFIEKSSEQD